MAEQESRDDSLPEPETNCDFCGGKGHNPDRCPWQGKSKEQAGANCDICGSPAHMTKRCPHQIIE